MKQTNMQTNTRFLMKPKPITKMQTNNNEQMQTNHEQMQTNNMLMNFSTGLTSDQLSAHTLLTPNSAAQ